MPIVYARRTAKFNAAHRLHNPDRSDEWNQATFGKCNNPDWHGHNYTLEIVVAGEPNPETGFIVDLAELKQIIDDRVISKCDHRNLNTQVDFLNGKMTSTENLAIGIWHQLVDHIPSGTLHCVRLHETDNNMVEYFGD